MTAFKNTAAFQDRIIDEARDCDICDARHYIAELIAIISEFDKALTVTNTRIAQLEEELQAARDSAT